MKTLLSTSIGSLVVALLPLAAETVFYPIPGLVDTSTGMMESKISGDWYRGSAVVARDPKLIYSCAHLFFEGGKWATDYRFHRAYHGKDYPALSDGASPRGLHYFTSYSSGVKSHGGDSDEAFASDFTVLYGNSSFGNAVSWWHRGGDALRSNGRKRVVGYPSDIDFTGDSGWVFQHSTNWFDFRASRIYGSYYEFDDVSTGPGNSGGPVFVEDSAGNSGLAGILVAGTRRSAGAVALDLSTDTMAAYALGIETTTRSFQNAKDFKIPDGSKTFTSVPIRVSGFTGAVEKLELSLSITTPTRGDLEVYLRSPTGRIRWIAKQAGGSADNLEIDAMNLTKNFRGYGTNGTWTLQVRDATKGSPATVTHVSLRISAL